MQNHFLLPESIECAYEAIEAILIEGSNQLYSFYISAKSRPFGSQTILDLLICILEMYLIRHEAPSYELWSESPEVVPCKIDTWARNTIPTHIRYITPKSEPEQLFTDVPSAKSIRTNPRSARSSRSGFKKSLYPRKSALGAKDNSSIDETAQPFPILIPPIQLSEEEETLRMKKENEFKKKAEEDKKFLANKQLQDELEKKLKKDAADIKDKPFTYNLQGNILFVNHLNFENIPKVFSEIQFKKPDDPPPPGTTAGRSRKKIEDVTRLKTAPVREQEWVKNATLVQPNVFETIHLANGVTIGDGNRVKAYAKHSASHKNLTRREYFHLNTTRPPALPMLEKRSINASSQDSFKLNSKLSSHRDVIEEIPDYEDISDLITENQQIFPLKPSRNPQGKVKVFGTGAEYSEDTSTDKFNAEILRNKRWGVNPPRKEPILPERLPKKPEAKELIKIYGDVMKKPKDKPFITPMELWQEKGASAKKPRDRPFVEKIEKKTKLPPPPFGYTMLNLPDY